MPDIVVGRAGAVSNWYGPFRILIDGKARGTIDQNETKRFEVSAGHHIVIIEFDIDRSEEFAIEVESKGTFIYCGGSIDLLASLIFPNRRPLFVVKEIR